MKINKIFKSAAVLLTLMLLLVLASCNGNTPEQTTEETQPNGPSVYTISVTDYKGNAPETDVLVEVKKGDETVGMKKADGKGRVSFELERGDYTFVPTAAGGEYYYDAEECVLSADKTDATVVIYKKSGDKATIYPSFGSNDERSAYDAALVGEGATYVEIDRDDIAYYIFTPTRGGIYSVSCIADGEVGLGFYGDANVVRDDDIAKLDENGAFRFEVKNGSVGTDFGGTLRLVIGLRSATVDNAIIVVERIGDPEKEVEWTNIPASELPANFERTDMLNHKLVNISVTDPSVKLVYSDEDGCFHYGSESGPVVYMRISSSTKFLNSFTEICETAAMCRIYYDESGKVSRKDGYNEMIAAYAEICDGNGVCPLTNELMLMLQNVGEHMGWWDFGETGNQIFTNDYDTGEATGVTKDNIVKGNEWMFALCYVEKFVGGSADKPIGLQVSDTLTYYAELVADGTLYFTATANAQLTIEGAAGISVKCGDVTYTADAEGRITLNTAENDIIEMTSDKSGVISLKYILG